MAASLNKNTKKSTNVKRNTTTKSASKKNTSSLSPAVKDELTILIVLGVAILLVLSTFDLCGKVGAGISYFTFGMLGAMEYVFPFILFFVVVLSIANRNKVDSFGKKLVAIIIIIITICSLMQMAVGGYESYMTLGTFFKNSAAYRTGGGLIGGILCSILTPLFGKVGATVIIVIIMLVAVVIIAGKAIFTALINKSKSAAKRSNEVLKQKHLENKARREEEKAAALEAAKEKAAIEAADIEEEKHKIKDMQMIGGEIRIDDNSTKPVNILMGNEEDDSFEKADISAAADPEVKNGTRFRINVNHMQELKNTFAGTDDGSVVKENSISAEKPDDTQPVLVVGNPKGKDKDFFVQQELQVSDEIAVDPDMDISLPNIFDENEKKEKIAKGQPIPLKEEDIAPVVKEYIFPPMSLLDRGKSNIDQADLNAHLEATAQKLQDTLDSFKVRAQVTDVSCGPSVTRFEIQPELGVKVSSIVNLADDIKLNLAVQDVRIEAPIPGKAAVGIEVPNKDNSTIMLRDLLETDDFQSAKSKVSFAVGRDISGKVIVTDISKMPHVLIAGQTGSGKSVCINTMIMSIIYKAKPDEVRLIMIDPKVVELSVYNGIPHLLIPVVTDPKKAAGALQWAVKEMTDRYHAFAELGVRDIKGYNEKIQRNLAQGLESDNYKKMPQIVIIIDELADLMMVAPGECEDAICRLSQLARAAGIFLVVATQRPSVNVITGVIKANIPSRIAFAVASQVDSRTILDMAGAEKLLGKGDMLFYPTGAQKPSRVQGAFVSDEEISKVVNNIKDDANQANYESSVLDAVNTANIGTGRSGAPSDDRDMYFTEAGKFIIDKDKASIGMLQRVFKIGFNRAARIMEQLYEAGVVGPEEGTKPRKILMTEAEFQKFIDDNL